MPKISGLPTTTTPTGADILPLVQSGTTKQTTFAKLPISDAVTTALALKADANNTNLTGTTTINGTLTGAGVTKAAVGLGNVDNTSDVNKPVSTAQSAAITGIGSFKNKIRNPKMEIAQRGTTITSPASGAYLLDGWQLSSNGSQVITVSQQFDNSTWAEYNYNLRVQVTTANAAPTAGNFVAIEQPIEGYLIRDLVGNPIALQFDVKSAKIGTHCVALRNSGFDRAYVLTYNVTAANTWQNVKLSLPSGLITAGTWNFTNGTGVRISFVLLCGATYQTTAGAWQTGSFIGTSAQVNCMDTVGNIFAVSAVQMERDRGQGSTAFEHRDPASELVLAQRYYQEIGTPGFNDLVVGGYLGGAGAAYHTFVYPVRMRATPTISTGGTAFTTSGLSSATFGVIGPSSCRLDVASAGAVFYIWQNASGSCRLCLSSEL